MRVSQCPQSGKWQVVGTDGTVLAVAETNSAAWRAHDLIAREHLNRAEATSDWVVSQSLRGNSKE